MLILLFVSVGPNEIELLRPRDAFEHAKSAFDFFAKT